MTRVAVLQPEPAFFDPGRAIDTVAAMTAEAAGQGARLVLFPEAFIGGYPWGLAFGAAVGGRLPEGRRGWERYWRGAIDVPGSHTERLGQIAREHGVYLAGGVIERDTDSSRGTLYCTLLYFGPDGSLLGKHRKLKPTASERLIWGEGDGSTLPVIETELGRMGGLICWENYMPLARAALYGKGVELYLAPTADARDGWQATLRHIALEGRCFVLGSNQYVRRSDYPDDLELAHELEKWPELLCRGGSAIYGPMGDCLAGPLWEESGILMADLDMGEIVRGKFDFDVTGHYARPDVFRLTVDETPRRTVEYGAHEGGTNEEDG